VKSNQLLLHFFSLLFIKKINTFWLINFLQLFGEVNCLDQTLLDGENLRFEEEEQFLMSSLEDNIPFLQMLQNVETPQFFPLKEPNFQTLLRLQHMKKPWEDSTFIPRMDSQQVQTTLEFESCVTQDILEMQSPVKSESNELLQHKVSASCIEKMSYECNQEHRKIVQSCSKSQLGTTTKEKRKRKRTRPVKNKEDVESQRMTHIAVERNRRRQMNDHLSVLRSLMPSSYIQRVSYFSINCFEIFYFLSQILIPFSLNSLLLLYSC
jgi:hypothetical protein